jgi:hypothetical protein
MAKKKDSDRIASLLERVRNLERLLKKSRKSEKFWKKMHSMRISEGIDLSLALKWAARDRYKEYLQLESGSHPSQKGKWE